MICGGAMLGYDSTPRLKIDSTPPSVIRIATTQAKTGWSMKNRGIGLVPSVAVRSGGGSSRRRRLPRHGPGRRTGTHRLHARDDHPIAGGEPRADDPVVAVHADGADVAARHLAITAHDQHVIAGDVALHRRLRNQKGVAALTQRDLERDIAA